LIVESEDYNPFYPLILIGWSGDIHYELLLSIGLPKEEYPFEASKTINLTKFIDINLVNSKNNNCNDKNDYSYKENNKKNWKKNSIAKNWILLIKMKQK